jgi:hypothetical protein
VGLALLGVPHGRLAVEKRPMAETPPLSRAVADPTAYGPALAAYCRDAAPFRDHLIRAGFRGRLAFFGQSPVPSVLVGRRGWLYFTQESALDDYLNAIPLTDEAIDIMVRVQVERRDWLAARGTAFLVVLAPNKASVYPEHMPKGLHPLGTVSRVDQLVGPLRRAGVAVLDLREPLRRAKAAHRAYLKTDTHWNKWGAFQGSAAIVDALGRRFPALPALRVADYAVEAVRQPGGDLAEMLLMPDLLPEVDLVPRSRGPVLAHAAPNGAYPDPADQPERDRLAFATDRTDWPRAVFFHDSFTRPMAPYLAERFSRSVFLWSHAFAPDIIRAERPDVVVLEVVERYIYALTLANPPEVRQAAPLAEAGKQEP